MELNFGRDLGYTCRNKMPKIPIDSMRAEKVIQGQSQNFLEFFEFFLKTVRFIENIAQTKIVDHKIIYKNVSHTFFPKNHHS